MANTEGPRAWWREAAVYKIYTRFFLDAIGERATFYLPSPGVGASRQVLIGRGERRSPSELKLQPYASLVLQAVS